MLHYYPLGYSRKKTKEELKIWNFHEYQRCGISKGDQEKNSVEFPGVFIFSLGISKRSNTILWRWSFVLSRISRGKVKK